jgi:hypothetical protein
MATSGKKRVRKAESDEAMKKQKAVEAKEAAVPMRHAAVAPAEAVAASVVVKKGMPKKASASMPALAEKEPDTIGNPYEEKRPLAMKEAPTPVKKPTKTEVVAEVSLNGAVTMDHPYASPAKKRITSVPCILLFLVAFFLWCSVTLLGLLLSERLEHQLQIHHLKQVLAKSEAVGVPPPPTVEELQKNVKHWKDLVKNLELQKRGMLQEFGEKLASLESME